MKIKTVGYGRVINTGNYESIKYYLEAEVEVGEIYQDVLDTLAYSINELESERKRGEQLQMDCHKLEFTKNGLRSEISRLEGKLKSLQLRWDNAVKFVSQFGIDPASAGLESFYWMAGEAVEEEIGEEDEDEEDEY